MENCAFGFLWDHWMLFYTALWLRRICTDSTECANWYHMPRGKGEATKLGQKERDAKALGSLAGSPHWYLCALGLLSSLQHCSLLLFHSSVWALSCVNGGLVLWEKIVILTILALSILVGGQIWIEKFMKIFPVGGRRGLMQYLCSRKESEFYHEADLSLLCKGIFWKTFSDHVF